MAVKPATIEKSKLDNGNKLTAVHGQFVGTKNVCQYKCDGGDFTLQFGPLSYLKQKFKAAKKTGLTQKNIAEALEYKAISDDIDIRYELSDHHATDVMTISKPTALAKLEWDFEKSDDIVISVVDGCIVIDSKAFNITDDPAYPSQPYCRLAQIDAPVVKDATGMEIAFEYQLLQNTLRLVPKDDVAKAQFPLTIDPAYTITSISKCDNTALIWSPNLKRLFAIWVREVAGDRHCYLSYSDNGGVNWMTFGTAVSSGLTLNGGMSTSNAILDAGGIMHIFFGAYPQSSSIGQLFYRRFNPQTMQYIDAQAIKLTNEVNHNTWNNIDIDNNGIIHIAVTGRFSSTACYTARYLSFDPNNFATPIPVVSIGTEYQDSGATAGFNTYGATIVVDHNNDLHMVWHNKNDSTGTTYQIYYRKCHDGFWDDAITLTEWMDYPDGAQVVRLFEDTKTGDIMLLFVLYITAYSIHALMNIRTGAVEPVYDSGYSQGGGILFQYPNNNLALLFHGYSQQYPSTWHLRIMYRIDGVWQPDQQMYYNASGPVQITNHPFDRTRYANSKMRALAGALCNFRYATGSSNCFKTDNFALAARQSIPEW